MNNQSIWYFDNTNLYHLFCPHTLKDYTKTHVFVKYKKGDFIYFQKDLSTRIFLVVSGKVKISTYTQDGKEVVKAILSKGEIFGEMALLGEDYRSDFAQVTEENTELCPLDTQVMHDLMRRNRDLSFKIYKIIGFRIHKLERKVESLIAKDVKTRLIEFLKDLAQEQGQKIGFETLIRHSLTQKDIADLIGTSRQTVTTLLNELKEQNFINFDRKKILIRDLKQLDKALLTV
jgi:CRP/FNR family transcriptional regulator, cyclic AMP receptor protein